MRIIKKYGRLVQMREMGKNLIHLPLGDKKIVVSFDDGYSDNFYNAKPILERHEVPATFFIVSGALDSREEYWWDELERIILVAAALPPLFDLTIAGNKYRFPIISENGQQLQNYARAEMEIPQNDTVLSKDRLYFALWRILSHLSFQEKKVALRQIDHWSGRSLTPRPTHLAMTSQELVSLAACPLFEIGAHTVCHPLLSRLALQEQEREIADSKRDLENMIGRTITGFSYPHGDYSTETVKIVERLKFRNACTIHEQPVKRNHSPYLLPRFAVLNWSGEEFEKRILSWVNQ